MATGRRSVARWRDWGEWQEVHAGLFAEDLYAQEQALARVAAWRSRGEVPIAVNATAQLCEIRVHERKAPAQQHAIGASARSHMELSLLYAATIVRCVNGLVDGAQKGTYAMAVSGLAQRIGIPLWIVDLRHESTHNQLPSLPVLRFAAEHLLAWLRANYWHRQEDVLRSWVQKTATILKPRLHPVMEMKTDNATATEPPQSLPPLKDLLDIEQLRAIVVPLLVDGRQYGELEFPTGALFAPELLARLDSTAPTEAEVLAAYPRDAFFDLLLELQSLWSHWSAALLAALCQKLLRLAEVPDDDNAPSVALDIEIGLMWVKLLVSNEWREKLKYAEEPIEEIYQSGAAMFALVETTTTSSKHHQLNQSLIDRLRAILRTCKGIRNHPASSRSAAMPASAANGAWVELSEWSMTPLGVMHGYCLSEFDGLAEFSVDADEGGVSGSVAYCHTNEEVDEDDEFAAMEELMRCHDAAYDREVQDTLTLKQSVRDHVIHGGQSGVNQKVLPQQEVERIQSQIEIW